MNAAERAMKVLTELIAEREPAAWPWPDPDKQTKIAKDLEKTRGQLTRLVEAVGKMQHAESLVGMKGVLRNDSGEAVRASVVYRENKKLAYTLAAEIKAEQEQQQ